MIAASRDFGRGVPSDYDDNGCSTAMAGSGALPGDAAVQSTSESAEEIRIACEYTGGVEVSPREDGESCFPTLSPREREVARALAVGYTNREIADTLGISVKTVDTHRGHVMRKLGYRNNAELARGALRVGLVTLERTGHERDAKGV